MSTLHYRYPGVKPFETSEAHQYFGRARDIQDLFDLIMLEKLIVLFGKSGYGKSSLLNAGILPKLARANSPKQQTYGALTVKFSSFTQDSSKSPVQALMERLRQSYPTPKEKTRDAAFNRLKDTVWMGFKEVQDSYKTRKFVLIFDQFEEYFTYPKYQQVQFCEQLAELLYTEVPQELRNAWDQLNDSDKEFLSAELDVHVVFAIREDRLSWMSSMREYLPSILHKRYELKGLSDEQAREAILKPANLPQSQGFISHQFDYTERALSILLEELKKGGNAQDNSNQGRIEAFLLQICCENIERKLIERAKLGDVDVMVDPEDLPKFDRIYEEYYYNKINELPASQRPIAQRLIEDELVAYNDATGVVFRLSADGRKLCAQPEVTEELLKQLTDSFLLRAEPNTTGGFNYEISHDTLVTPVLKAKEIRLEAERKTAEEQKRIAREKELEQERKKRRNATLIAVAGVILSLFAFVASWYAFRLRDEALTAQRRAEQAEEAALQSKAETEQHLKELQHEKAIILIRDGDSFLQNDEFKLALGKYKKALELMPGDSLILKKIERCK